MRILTIRREKSFVACLAKMKVYIEDPASPEILINDTPCRKIGDLKNGEEKTFQVGDQAAKVFIIADKISKNYSNEFYQLPEGQEDVFLSGKNKYNPVNGNAFRFDHNEGADAVANRKKGNRKGIMIMIVAVVVGIVIGLVGSLNVLFDKEPEPKTFTSSGMSITMTDEFEQVNMEDFTAVFESRDVAVFIIKENFTLMEGIEEFTLDEYVDMVIQGNPDLKSVTKKTTNGLVGFEYSASVDNEDYQYFSYAYKTDNAFWLVQFATPGEDADEYAKQIEEWAKSVKFAK